MPPPVPVPLLSESARLLVMVTPVRVVLPPLLKMPPPSRLAELPLTVLFVRVSVPQVVDAAAVAVGGVAADGAVRQGERAAEAEDAAAAACCSRW